ncbi:MAG: hypothetical protein C4555_04480 [Dehalococcoidia bacterium]|nr:MAG: hypothetical protein C4555_04480 [Dehalococcoidia bacterium]
MFGFTCIDFETYFDSDYTLTKLTTEAYVRDPRFEVLCVAIDGKAYPPSHVAKALAAVNWDQPVLAHHAQFDGLILSHHFGHKPRLWLDTMSLARYRHGPNQSLSLANLAAKYDLAEKSVPYEDFRGKRWADMGPLPRDRLMEGCAQDTRLTRQLAEQLLPGVPAVELGMMDMTIRMFTEPRLDIDRHTLVTFLGDEAARKESLLKELGLDAKVLRSDRQFAALLENEFDIDLPLKPGKNGPIPATARKDAFMEDALAGEYGEDVRLFCEARLDLKSTMAPSRAQRLIDMGGRGRACVYMGYSAAHTRRWGGGDKMNFQNFPREDTPGGKLRHGLRAPAGHVLIKADLAQIELRVNAWCADQENTLQALREERDIYSESASDYYGRKITKADVKERQAFKVVNLSGQFGRGHKRLYELLRKTGITLEQAEGMTQAWRRRNDRIVQSWRDASNGLETLAGQRDRFNLLKCGIKPGEVLLPSGQRLLYVVRWQEDQSCWARLHRKSMVRFRPPTLCQNIVQSIARDVLALKIFEVFKHVHVWPVLSSHDDACWLIEERDLEDWTELLEGVFTAPVPWLPGLPIRSEIKTSKTYFMA